MKQASAPLRPSVPPLPADAPLLSIEDAAAYLRLTPAAVRQLLRGRTDGADKELGDLLRSWLVVISPKRRYIRRDALMAWLKEKAAPTE